MFDNSALPFRIYARGELMGAVAYAEDAAALVAVMGDGAKIVTSAGTVWREGEESQPAGESYDYVAQVIEERAKGRIPPKVQTRDLCLLCGEDRNHPSQAIRGGHRC